MLGVAGFLRAEAGLGEVDLAEPAHQSGHQLEVAVTKGGLQWLAGGGGGGGGGNVKYRVYKIHCVFYKFIAI